VALLIRGVAVARKTEPDTVVGGGLGGAAVSLVRAWSIFPRSAKRFVVGKCDQSNSQENAA